VPYRTHRRDSSCSRETPGDGDLLPVALVLWCASVAFSAHQVTLRQSFSGDAILAMICVLAVPYAAVRGIKKV
jgi:hypothetical protein